MPSTSNGSGDGAIRKAAILIATLDTSTADALLDKMSPEQAAQVRQAVMELDDIGADEEAATIREFLGDKPDRDDGDGVELELGLVRKLSSPADYESAGSTPPQPFQALCEVSVDAVSRQLERQHPQVVALVLAHLPAGHAAEIVKQLSLPLQADVLRRVAELDLADPEVVRDIEHELEQLLSGEIRRARNRSAGISTVAAIVQAAGTQGRGLIGNLAQHDRQLASQLRDAVQPRRSEDRTVPGERLRHATGQRAAVAQAAPIARRTAPPASASGHPPAPAVTFEELVLLSDDDWAALVRAVEPNTLFLALAGADERLIGRMARQLPGREAQALRRRLEQIGPVRLADIDQAQRLVAERAAELMALGRLANIRRQNFAAAA